jgi:hypothetical protein
MSGYVCVVDVPAMSISGGDARPGGQVLGWVARYPRGGIAARRRAGDVSQCSRACAGLLAVRGFGVDALALRLSAIGARYATASSVPLRRVRAAHRGKRATVGPSGPDDSNPLAWDPWLTRQNPSPCTPRSALNNPLVLPPVWWSGWDDRQVQGAGNSDPELMDAGALVGHLVPAGSVFAFLAEHRGEVFPSELFVDLFPSSTGRPSLPGEVAASVLVLQTLQDLSDRDAVVAVRCDIRWKVACGLPLDHEGFHPSTLTYWRRRLAVSDRPNRIFDAVRAVIAQTGVLTGKTRRALDSVVCDDAVATGGHHHRVDRRDPSGSPRSARCRGDHRRPMPCSRLQRPGQARYCLGRQPGPRGTGVGVGGRCHLDRVRVDRGEARRAGCAGVGAAGVGRRARR